MNADLNRAADGVVAALLAIVGALLVLAAWLARWLVRLVWRHRHRVPHGHVLLPALGVYVPLWLVTGSPVVAALVVGRVSRQAH